MLNKHLEDLSEKELQMLLSRTGELNDVNETVSLILKDIQNRGDKAIKEYTEKFDKAVIQQIEVSSEEIEAAFGSIDKELVHQLERAAENIRKFHSAQLPKKTWFMEIEEGITLGQQATPLASVGAYVPGGRASYPSTALMTIIPAKVAGVKNVIMCTPPGPDGKVNPLTLAAGKVAGADHIYRIGGVQAVGAMAYGTESVISVDKIVGPGNLYVTAAKMLVRDRAEIDFPAGPSEVLIIADGSASPRMIAADIIAQAEHDPSSISVLITTSERIAKETEQQVIEQTSTTARKEIVEQSLKNAAIITAPSMDECIKFSNDFAPEHLEIVVKEEQEDLVLEKIENAGSIFAGKYTPVAAGDYASGTNHVLPTAGYAKLYSGLNINHFLKYSTIQKLTKNGLRSLSSTIISIAEEEGLKAHADSVRCRLEE